MQDTDIKQQLETLVTTWGRLSLSVLGDCNCSAPAALPCTSSPPVASFTPSPCPCSDPKNPDTPDICALSSSSTPSPVLASPSTHAPSKKAKARAKAKARNKSKQDAALEEPSIADIQDHLRNSVTSRDWVMLSSSLPPSTSHPTGDGLRKFREEWDGSGWSDPVAALRCIHGIVAPIVLRDTAHLDRLHQLKTALSRAGHGTQSADAEGSCVEEDVCPSRAALAITTSVVCVVGGDKGSQDELQVSLLMTYCFLCAALMHHLKAVGGIKHRTHEHEDGTGDR
jgi:hypothetical protein